MPYADASTRRAELLAWHRCAAVGLAVMATVGLLAALTTGEAGQTWPFYLGTLIIITAVLTSAARWPKRQALLVWPALDVLGLWGLQAVAPEAATLCTATIVLAFLLVGLTQPRGTSAALWPLAILVWWQLNDLTTEQSLVRGSLATMVWISVAELPAWLAARIAASRVELTRLARTDPLTGLANRLSWQQNFGLLLAEGPVSVLLIDLDHFKRYNDECGHLAGDGLLVSFADSLRAAVRSGDLVARWGGEEFVVALPGVTRDQARAIADRILATVPGGQSCSIGLVEHAPQESADAVLNRADQALYRAKDNGRNRIVAAWT